jgi:hypothetical protein
MVWRKLGRVSICCSAGTLCRNPGRMGKGNGDEVGTKLDARTSLPLDEGINSQVKYGQIKSNIRIIRGFFRGADRGSYTINHVEHGRLRRNGIPHTVG